MNREQQPSTVAQFILALQLHFYEDRGVGGRLVGMMVQ